MCSMCCHMALVLAFMHLYSILTFKLFLPILFYNFCNQVLKRQTETLNGTSISELYLPLFFLFFLTRAIPKGLCLYVFVYVMCMFCIAFNLCEN